MTVFLAKCCHNPNGPAGICELQAGVLICPCSGKVTATLSVDNTGQLVWTAQGPDGNARAHHTYVALRKEESGLKAVPLIKGELKPVSQQGAAVFPVTCADNTAAVIRVDEFMRRSLAGDEFVELA